MGFNTTVVVLNDALDQISKDPLFGQKLADAVLYLGGPSKFHLDIPSGNSCNAATVVETHHADEVVVVAVGGNYGRILGYGGGWKGSDLDILKSLAWKMGYTVHKKPSKPRGKK